MSTISSIFTLCKLPYRALIESGFSFCLKKVTKHGQLDEGKEEKMNQDKEKGRKDIEDNDKTGYLQENVEGHWVMTVGQRQHGTVSISRDYDDCVGL